MIAIFNCILLLPPVVLSVSSDFSLKGDPCSNFDSCYSKSVLRTCSCDSHCRMYGTCCHDMKKPLQDVSGHTFRCYSRRTVNPVFAKRSCSKDFRGHVGDKLACLDDDEDEMDVKNSLLMTSRRTKTTYWNKQCAKCNYEEANDLEFWNIVVSCPSSEDVDSSLIRKNLTFDQDKLQWVLKIGDEFLQCVVKYSPPVYFHEAKYCNPNTISSCPVDYNNEDISTKCSQYYAERKLKNSEVYFKNIHCAICNGADVRELECPGMSSLKDDVDGGNFREMVEVVFSNGEWLKKEPGKRFECSKGYSYDPFLEKCRREEIKGTLTMIPNSAYDCRKNFFVLLAILLTFLFIK